MNVRKLFWCNYLGRFGGEGLLTAIDHARLSAERVNFKLSGILRSLIELKVHTFLNFVHMNSAAQKKNPQP